MPPEIGRPLQRGQIVDDNPEGGFFSKIPMWVWIGLAIVVVYFLYTKLGTNSSSTPAVSTVPDQSGTPLDNFTAALQQILANQEQNQNLGGSSGGSSGNKDRGRPKPSQSPPMNTWVRYVNPGSSISGSGSGGPLGNGGPGLKVPLAPTAPPISSASHLLRGSVK